MPDIQPRKISKGELAEQKRLRKLETIRQAKSREPLPTSKHYNGMPLKPPRYDYSGMDSLRKR